MNLNMPATGSISTSGRKTKKEQLVAAMTTARGFVVLLLIIFIGIKTVLLVTESAVTLKAWEWIPIWPAISYQHVILSVLCFGVFTLLLFVGGFNRYLGMGMLAVVCALQFVLPFLHISSLRVEQILGSYTTFEMTQADSEGSVFTGALFDKDNLIFTLPGLFLSIAAVAIPLVFKRRTTRLLSFLTAKRAAIIVLAWVAVGVGSKHVLSSFIGVAANDPIIFFYADLVEKQFSFLNNEKTSATNFPTKQIYGSKKVIPTQTMFSDVERWRKTKKNVVLVILESMPAAQASFMGRVKYQKEVRDTLPNLSAMRKNMFLWKNHYTVHPTSMNSLFSINCSMYPNPAGDNITATNPRIPCRSLSEVLAEKGYTGALFHSGRFSFWNKTKFFKDRGFAKMYDARNMPGKKIEKFKWGIDEQATARAVVDFMGKNKKKPFFVEYITVFPHVPYDYKDGPWAIFPVKKPIDRYHNSLRYADSAIKIVVDGVKKLRLEKDTLFVFVSDHGEAFYEHRGNRVHSIYVYEENVHTAMAMYNPILFPKLRATDRVTGHIDILPTIADLLEIPHAKPWQGESLLEDGPSPLRYFLANWGSKFGGVRDDQYKAIWNKDTNAVQIFDLKRDRKERKDLAAKYPDRVDAYRSAIMNWWMYQVKLIPSFGR